MKRVARTDHPEDRAISAGPAPLQSNRDNRHIRRASKGRHVLGTMGARQKGAALVAALGLLVSLGSAEAAVAAKKTTKKKAVVTTKKKPVATTKKPAAKTATTAGGAPTTAPPATTAPTPSGGGGSPAADVGGGAGF
jgi:cytoskeletal protein RodZ